MTEDECMTWLGLCLMCGRRLPASGRGRQRRTCSDACRMALYRKRRRWAVIVAEYERGSR
jgi:predicted nucleic acid-binding Zn ribbon protein